MESDISLEKPNCTCYEYETLPLVARPVCARGAGPCPLRLKHPSVAFCSFPLIFSYRRRLLSAYLIIRRASVEVLEGTDDVLAEARSEHVLLLTELVPRLTHDGVDDV